MSNVSLSHEAPLAVLRQYPESEIQRRVVAEKLFAWPLYLAYLHAHHRVPVTLLVLTFDVAVATWARESRPVGPNLQCTPWVLGPSDHVWAPRGHLGLRLTS